jgi:TRAP-type C4-dicarboxylate transport system permease small subunit
MNGILLKVKKGLIAALNWMLIVAVAVLVLSVCWGVFTRYVMGEQAQWTEEIARFLLIWISLLGGAVAFGTKGHLGVDFLVEKFHPDAKRGMAVAVHLTVLIFAFAIFIYGGCQIVADALMMEQTTPAMGWKMGYVYLALPISGIFMVLFTLENLIETLTGSFGVLPDANSAGGLE